MSNQPKLKVGECFIYTKEMSNNRGAARWIESIGETMLITGVESESYDVTPLQKKSFIGRVEFKYVDPFLPSNKSLVKQPEVWTQKTEYISKSGFKIEKDKITFPDGKTYTFDQFTKHYNQLRSVYRKLSDLKKIKVFP